MNWCGVVACGQAERRGCSPAGVRGGRRSDEMLLLLLEISRVMIDHRLAGSPREIRCSGLSRSAVMPDLSCARGLGVVVTSNGNQTPPANCG